MATVDELMVVLDADPTGLEDGMRSAGDATDDFTQQLLILLQLQQQQLQPGDLILHC